MNTKVNLEINDNLKLPAGVVAAGIYADSRTCNLIIKGQDDRWITLGGEWINPPSTVYEVAIAVEPGRKLRAAARKHRVETCLTTTRQSDAGSIHQ